MSNSPSPHPSHTPHADRAIILTEFGEPFTREEAPTPRGRLWSDLLLQGPGPRSPVWGPLVPWMSGQSVAVEFESGLLTQEKISRFVAKAHLLREASTTCAEARFAVFCNEYPRERLRELKPYLSRGPCHGAWEINGGGLGRGMIVALRKLPLIDGTSVLRMIPQETRQAEVTGRIRHLLTDKKIPQTINESIMDAVRNEKLPMSDEEKNMSFQEFVQHIERRGAAASEARGKAIGEAHGEARAAERERQSIISFATGLLPPERIEQLQSMQDLDLLRAAFQAALRERVR
jgi:hypothetical protein